MQTSSCGAIDEVGLRNASRHRHSCEVLRRVCFVDGTLVPLTAGPDADHARNIAETLIIRSAFGSHATFPFAHLHAMKAPEADSAVAKLLSQAKTNALSACVPLVWVPVWAFSFADSFASSLVPIDELQSAGLIDQHIQFRPDLWAWPRSRNPIYRMIQALSSQPIRSLREVAPKLSDAAKRRVLAAGHDGYARRRTMPTCYERVLLCQFKSTFDEYKAPMAPWRAGQRVAASVLGGAPVDATTALNASDSQANLHRPDRTLRVVFVNRTRTKFSRSLANLGYLLKSCARHPRFIPGWRVECHAHEFGRGLAADVISARHSDVLVGTHGAGLANAFFMRRGASLVEVRPYRFEGTWPDRYFRAWSALEQAVHYYQVTSGSAALSIPQPVENVSIWDARDHAVRLPWRTLKDVLGAVVAVGGVRESYVRQLWAQGTVFVSQAQVE